MLQKEGGGGEREALTALERTFEVLNGRDTVFE